MITSVMERNTSELSQKLSVVLAVEDNKLLMILLEDSLSSDRYRARVVASSKEALEIIENGERVDLLVTDYMLPDIDGVELTQKVRRQLPDLKVILISGLSPEFVEIPADLPDVSFMQKPYDPLALRARVESILLG